VQDYWQSVGGKRAAGRITQTFHDEIATELEKKQQELNDRLKLLTNDNKQFQVTASYLLDLAQRADQLFKESDEGLRQKLLEYVLSNIELKDKKLSYILNDPFRTIVEAKKKSLSAHNSNLWCGYRDSNPGPHPWQGCALTAELHPHVYTLVLYKYTEAGGVFQVPQLWLCDQD
jgi:hypothetical protein